MTVCSVLLAPAVGLGNPIPVGACCLAGGECQLLSEDQCLDLGGYWAGYWDCEPNPCPPFTGACCLPGGSCLITTLPQCIEVAHGAWYGSDIPCNPNPCPPCLLPCGGACCFSDGHCEHLAEPTCLMLGGTFTPLIDCSPDPCAASGVEDVEQPKRFFLSWGKIKGLFR
jgi:hypothetical protein